MGPVAEEVGRPPHGAVGGYRHVVAPRSDLLTGEFRLSPVRTLLALGRDRRVLVGRRFTLHGAQNVHGELHLGLVGLGFAPPRLGGIVRVEGSLVCQGWVGVMHGNSWWIAEGATVTIGGGTMFSPSGRLYARHRIEIGSDTAVGWETQILDDNQHPISYDGRERRPEGTVRIGDHVWIGSRVSVLAGTAIGDHCVVAAGSIVKGDFSEPHCLIAGVPARVVRRGVDWRFDRDEVEVEAVDEASGRPEPGADAERSGTTPG